MSESFDLEKMLQSKRELRRELAARPLAEKLEMLDALRERAVTLRAATLRAATTPIQVLAGEKSSRTGSRQ